MKYSKMSEKRLRAELKKESEAFSRLPRRDSFSGLAIGGRLDEIQQEMRRRGLKWKPFYAEISIEVGG